MSDPSGWLWALLAILGVGELGLGIAYGSAMWSQRRRGSITKQKQDEAVRDNYRQEEIREKRHECTRAICVVSREVDMRRSNQVKS
jgi:hypothetical protein